ncbi:hypothetical protein P8452_38505 [Trifolium repens]|nr:hypothetical protein P8452_38505 [Trifolium repens]
MADCEVAARVGLARLRRVERMQNLKKRTSLGVNIPRPVFRRCCEASICTHPNVRLLEFRPARKKAARSSGFAYVVLDWTVVLKLLRWLGVFCWLND